MKVEFLGSQEMADEADFQQEFFIGPRQVIQIHEEKCFYDNVFNYNIGEFGLNLPDDYKISSKFSTDCKNIFDIYSRILEELIKRVSAKK